MSDLIFSVPRLVAELSAVVPLLPGDIIFSGTPAGVGADPQAARASSSPARPSSRGSTASGPQPLPLTRPLAHQSDGRARREVPAACCRHPSPRPMRTHRTHG